MPKNSISDGIGLHTKGRKSDCKVLSLDFTSYSLGSQILNWISRNCFQPLFFRKYFKTASTKNLQEILKNKSQTKSFRLFLQQEFSEENLDFWVEVEKYKREKPNQRQQRANKIFQTYIQVGSPIEINIDSRTRHATISNMMYPDKETFNLAQDQVYVLMERDSFVRFISKQDDKKINRQRKDQVKKEQEVCQSLSQKIKMKTARVQIEPAAAHNSYHLISN